MRVRKGIQYPVFDEKNDMRAVSFTVFLKFESREILKQAIIWYSIQQHKDILYMKNDKNRIHVGCAGCHWEMSAGHDLQQRGRWQIKSLEHEHRCARTFKNRLLGVNWLSRMFMDRILRNPRIKAIEIKKDVKSVFEVVVNIRKCQRAKDKALNAVENLMKKQYGILKPYLLELVRSNPGTTCVLKIMEAEPGQPATFLRFYICFAALKESMKRSCRTIMGVDGCFLKHACGRQFLCAVGRDGNNHIFPVAWAVVDRETRSSWEWFLRFVSEDLEMGFGEGWTLVSDQQKGLVPAIHEVWPDVEHRQCARHIYTNWSKVHKGNNLRRQFWRCVKAISIGQFETEGKALMTLSAKAHEDFLTRDPNTFCKSHFKTHSSCDSVDNNMAETFNSFILLAKYKPIVSMLEDIRLAVMDRLRDKKEFSSKFVAAIAPRISEKLEEAYEEQKFCHCRWSEDDAESLFEVMHHGVGHVVDLVNRTCSCRGCELTGIPCAHAMSAILIMNKQPENFVAKWYLKETYVQTYSTMLKPVAGTTFWDHEEDVMVLPPEIQRKAMGRRKTSRRKDPNEPTKKARKYSRKGLPTHCSRCKATDHNKKNCPLPPTTQQPQTAQSTQGPSAGSKKKGRPNGSKNRIGSGSREVARPADYIQKLGHQKPKERGQASGDGDQASQPWLETVTNMNNTKKRGRPRGKNKKVAGVGVLVGEGGETLYMAALGAPPVNLSSI